MATHPSQRGLEDQIVDVDVLLSGYDGGVESGWDRDDSDNQSSGPPPWAQEHKLMSSIHRQPSHQIHTQACLLFLI